MFYEHKIIVQLRKEILETINDLTWYDDPSKVTKYPQKGYYFFRRKDNCEIVYIGVAGIGTKMTLLDRIKQYYTPSDSGTRYFKMKSLGIERTEKEWNEYKAGELSQKLEDWRDYIMDNYEFCFLGAEVSGDEQEVKRELLIDECLLIGVFNPVYNY